MRARILGGDGEGSHTTTFNFKAQPPDTLTTEISRTIMGSVRFQIIRQSSTMLAKLGVALRQAAMVEASLMMASVAQILAIGETSFGGDDLRPPVLLNKAFNNRTLNPAGTVTWAPLTARYAHEKSQKYGGDGTRTEGLLTASGRMASYFRRYGKSMVEGRFGGVTIDIQPAQAVTNSLDIDGKGKAQDFRAISEGDRPSNSTLLGKINIRIFPNIATSLLPGLASRRWSDVGSTNGAMERAMLAPSVAIKLAGGGVGGTEVPYRPLILPITQFWMLIRIPNAIARALKANIRNRNSA